MLLIDIMEHSSKNHSIFVLSDCHAFDLSLDAPCAVCIVAIWIYEVACFQVDEDAVN